MLAFIQETLILLGVCLILLISCIPFYLTAMKILEGREEDEDFMRAQSEEDDEEWECCDES